MLLTALYVTLAVTLPCPCRNAIAELKKADAESKKADGLNRIGKLCFSQADESPWYYLFVRIYKLLYNSEQD